MTGVSDEQREILNGMEALIKIVRHLEEAEAVLDTLYVFEEERESILALAERIAARVAGQP